MGDFNLYFIILHIISRKLKLLEVVYVMSEVYIFCTASLKKKIHTSGLNFTCWTSVD
jgi:hypothetical protein